MVSDGKLLNFLLEAKRNTYAAEGTETFVEKPLVPGSKQLQFCSGEWLYCDIYFGGVQFTGQEIVYRRNIPVWAMSYSGGLIGEHSPGSTRSVYSFLRDALKLVSSRHPFRGPEEYVSGKFSYQSSANVSSQRFDGHEEIFVSDTLCYSLKFAGGCIL